MRYNNLVEALENNKNYRKDTVEVYGIATTSWGQAYFMNIAFDNEDEAFDVMRNYLSEKTSDEEIQKIF